MVKIDPDFNKHEHFSVVKDRVHVKFQAIDTPTVSENCFVPAKRHYVPKIIHTTDTGEVTWICDFHDLDFRDLVEALSGNKPTTSLPFDDENHQHPTPIDAVVELLKKHHGHNPAMVAAIAYTAHETGYHVKLNNTHQIEYPSWECVLADGRLAISDKFSDWKSAVVNAWRIFRNRSGLRDLWRPTHKITFWYGSAEPITWTVGMSPVGVVCTFEEWVDGTNSPAWTRVGNTWLHRGATTPWAMAGQLEIHEIKNHDTNDGEIP